MSWLAAGLCLRRHPCDDRELAWVAGCVSERGALVVPAMVADVGGLLLGRRARTDDVAPDDGLRRAIRDYDDRVLGRIAADPRLSALRDALAQLGDDDVSKAVALVAGTLMERLSGGRGRAVSVAEVRRLAHASALETEALGQEALRHDATLARELEIAYRAMVVTARGMPSLLDDGDVFLLENFDVLASLGERVAARQVAEAAQAWDEAWPRQMRPRRRRVGTVATALEAESSYPAGGFSSLAQGSNVSNLVPSELIYMDPAAERAEAGIDAFDVRYAEGALLQFVRDEGVILRERRGVFFVVDASLSEARIKEADVPWQRAVVVLGWLLAAVRKLETWLQAEALTVTVAFVGDAAALLRVEPEQRLSELMLRTWIDKGMVTVVACSRAELGRKLEEAPGETRVVWLAGPSSPLPEAHHLLAAHPGWSEWCRAGQAALASVL